MTYVPPATFHALPLSAQDLGFVAIAIVLAAAVCVGVLLLSARGRPRLAAARPEPVAAARPAAGPAPPRAPEEDPPVADAALAARR